MGVLEKYPTTMLTNTFPFVPQCVQNFPNFSFPLVPRVVQVRGVCAPSGELCHT